MHVIERWNINIVKSSKAFVHALKAYGAVEV